MKEIEVDNTIGVTAEHRLYNLNKAKKTADVLNIAGIVLTLWLYFYPQPYQLAITIALAFPVFVAFFFLNNKTVATFADSELRSAYPSFVAALILPALGLLIRAFFDYDLLNFADCLRPWAFAFIVVMIIMLGLLLQQKQKGVKNAVLIAVLFVLPYSYGAVICVNTGFDNGEMWHSYKAKVLKKDFSADSKHIEYSLLLSPWGNKKENEDQSVTYALYNRVNVGDSITIDTRKGYFNIPWYSLDK